jgi:hypothetical protein
MQLWLYRGSLGALSHWSVVSVLSILLGQAGGLEARLVVTGHVTTSWPCSGWAQGNLGGWR